MKKYIIAVLFVMITGFVSAEAVNGLTFINNTGYSLNELYISPSSHDDWYDNLLDGQELEDGESIILNLADYEDHDMVYDVLAVDVDGDSYSRYEIDLSENSSRTVELTFDDYEDSGEGYYDDDYDTGYNDGYSEGYKDGFKDAYSDAFREGYNAGFEEAKNM